MNMKKDNSIKSAISECLDKVAYIIATAEFDENGRFSDKVLTRLYAAEDLITLVEKELKQTGVI